MIICFKTHHLQQDPSYKSSLKWAHVEGEDFIPQEYEDADGDEIVGDRSYEGTPGQVTCLRLMVLLFDSPHSRAQYR
jgi:hypothetical protein